MPIVISFDIDGTLEVGDPPGIVTMDMVRRAIAHGHNVGSCSDNTVSNQIELWQEHQINVAFTILKHNLDDVKERFEAEKYFHLGDTFMDKYFANQSGFEFIDVTDKSDSIWEPFQPYLSDMDPWWIDPLPDIN